MEDRDILAGCLEGKKASWEAFVDRFAKLIHWSIRQTLEDSSFKGRTELCEDIFQDYFKSLLENDQLSKLREAGNLRKFLCVSARHRALDRIKHLSRSERSADPVMAPLVQDAPAQAADREAALLVQEVVEDLDPAERECLEMYYYDGKNHRQIGEALGWPQDTVTTVIRRCREKLKIQLIARGLDAP